MLKSRQITLEVEKYREILRDREKKREDNKSYSTDTSLLWKDMTALKLLQEKVSGSPYDSPQTIAVEEKSALIEFFYSLNGYSWIRNFGWKGQGKTTKLSEVKPFEPATVLWDGVETKTNLFKEASVSALVMEGYNLEGQLPGSLSNLVNCEVIRLKCNLIAGNLSGVRNLRKLVILDLSSNKISDSIAGSSLSSLNALTDLNLSSNAIDGSVPDIFGDLACLVRLDLSGNKLSGSLPDSLALLNSLEVLKLYSNCLSGPIPSSLSRLVKLREINLSRNRLSKGLWNILTAPAIEIIDCSHNALEDVLSDEEKTMEQKAMSERVRTLYVQGNCLSGIFPLLFCTMKSLRHLNLSHNNLRGTLPEVVSNLASLEVLALHGNSFQGPLPRSIMELKSLRDFTLFTDYPAETSRPVRAFQMESFRRIYEFGPSVGLNSVCES